ncbi:hypothetical protein [Bacteroides acidifaciens]|jgi:hypothetical protein|uniref:hypothetical protein n=1 Tax=Bacteroides acidifaciens TaxID=85831 RepID=UPI0026764592|nr:hypothetical protein [Bacteroides acidifaciens]
MSPIQSIPPIGGYNQTFPLRKRQEAGRSSLLAAICRHKVMVDKSLTPYDRITPMSIGGTPRTGNASEDWQRLR